MARGSPPTVAGWCDASCRVFDADGMVTDDFFVAGDVACWPHPLYDGQLLAVEHCGNAVEQARTAAHNMVCAPSERHAHKPLPAFWSNQFGINIKAVGLPTVADEVVVTQGSVEERRFVAAYGSAGRMVAAVAVDSPRWLEAYAAMIETGASFPPALNAADGPAEMRPVPAAFPPHGHATHIPTQRLPVQVRSRPRLPLRCRSIRVCHPVLRSCKEEIMPSKVTDQGNLFARVLDPANRPDPYQLYARLREDPISLQDDGTYVVSTYAEISTLLHDPRISSDDRKSESGAGALVASGRLWPEGRDSYQPFIFLDPPDHDRLRRIVMSRFTPARVEGVRDRISRLVNELLDAHRDRGQLDVVEDFAYPLPVAVICDLLGVPREDEPRFHGWASALARSLDPAQGTSEDEVKQEAQAAMQMGEYMMGLVADRRARPSGDLLSALVAGEDRMDEMELLSTLALLLVAGHETTVNLISNGTLALLRHPDVLDRPRREPSLIVTLFEEMLRYDPPKQFRTRTTLADIEVAGVTIPRGATVVLLLASGSRDPARFPEADSFLPDREDNQHLGFGGGAHYCVGAPLARMEAHIALSTLAHRLVSPRLLADLPSYRQNAALRGPEHLFVRFERLEERARLSGTLF